MTRKRKLLTSNGSESGTGPTQERYNLRPRNLQQVQAGVKKEEPIDPCFFTDEPTPLHGGRRWDRSTPKGNSTKPVIYVIKKEEPDEEEEQMTSQRLGRRRNRPAGNPSIAPPAKEPAHKLVHEVKEEEPEEEAEKINNVNEIDNHQGLIPPLREIHQEENIEQAGYRNRFVNANNFYEFIDELILIKGCLKLSKFELEKLQVLTGEDMAEILAYLHHHWNWSVAKNGFEEKSCRETRTNHNWLTWTYRLLKLAEKKIQFNHLETENERKHKTVLENWYENIVDDSGTLTQHQKDMLTQEVEMTDYEIMTWWAKKQIERFGAYKFLNNVFEAEQEREPRASEVVRSAEVGIDNNLIVRWLMDYDFNQKMQRDCLRLPHSEEVRRILSEILEGKITEEDLKSGNISDDMDVDEVWTFHCDQPTNSTMLISSGILTAVEFGCLRELYQKHPDSLEDFLMNSLEWKISTYMLVNVYEILRESE